MLQDTFETVVSSSLLSHGDDWYFHIYDSYKERLIFMCSIEMGKVQCSFMKIPSWASWTCPDNRRRQQEKRRTFWKYDVDDQASYLLNQKCVSILQTWAGKVPCVHCCLFDCGFVHFSAGSVRLRSTEYLKYRPGGDTMGIDRDARNIRHLLSILECCDQHLHT